ncbi:MAG TPA: hypothetical protein VE932_04950 [Patescibacteria group bacterium]|nr:hypothetical protein [Patescibacteria group bacterium]
MSIRVQRVAVTPLTLLAILERAREALDLGEPRVGRAFVDDAIQRLAQAKAAQDVVLDEAARTPETPGTSLDLAAD